MRRWLRVPAGLELPPWAQSRLAGGVAAELAARQGRPLDAVIFGIVDLETTGFSPRQDRIVEIGLVVQRGARILARESTLVALDSALPSAITALTGIDGSMLTGAPAESEALTRLAGVLREQRVERLVAHNARFDAGFLAHAWERVEAAPVLPGFLCSLRLARRLLKAPSYGLDRLVEQLGIPPAPRHRALGDAEMTAALWYELLKRARLQGLHTLEALEPFARLRVAPRPAASAPTVDGATPID
ncbi:MAG: PolC-type DNA polymerase III [Myxococcota bacterium]